MVNSPKRANSTDLATVGTQPATEAPPAKRQRVEPEAGDTVAPRRLPDHVAQALAAAASSLGRKPPLVPPVALSDAAARDRAAQQSYMDLAKERAGRLAAENALLKSQASKPDADLLVANTGLTHEVKHLQQVAGAYAAENAKLKKAIALIKTHDDAVVARNAKLKEQVQGLQQQNGTWATENAALKQEVRRLQGQIDGALVAENVHLRLELSMIKRFCMGPPPVPMPAPDASPEVQIAALKQALTLETQKSASLFNRVCGTRQAISHIRTAYAMAVNEGEAWRRVAMGELIEEDPPPQNPEG